MSDLLIINKNDNVGVSLKAGKVKLGHKVALKDIKRGGQVIKYGEVIGIAKSNIKKGDWVHSHNLASHLNQKFNYSYNPKLNKVKKEQGYFLGYKRKSGPAGIRNDIYLIPTVGCVNSLARTLKEKASKLKLGSIDNIFAITHQFGCSQLGEDHDDFKKLLVSLALNPNATYVIFIGLGCENNQISGIKELLKPYKRDNIFFYNAQEVDDDITYGFNLLKKLVDKASKLKRSKVSLSELTIGLKCGGSDAFSGLTANPKVGEVSDKLIAYGGSSVLTEVPEMFGAEQILMNKCFNKDIYQKYLKLITDFKKYYTDLGFPVYENPSPGNKEGGITTLEEKSLGCITKAGNTPIVDVLDYTQIVKKQGLNVLNGPGNDLIAATALAASGAQLILFTTGRGTPFVTIVPTLKIATNTNLARHKKNWIDFDAMSNSSEQLFKLVIDTASGNYKTKQEDNGEIAFFKKGVTL
ncbi:MAG: altronate dehydratase family protein [Bacilli bacterium]|nr:altronate dehydratase family protein [Bacilli bacterium]